MEKISSLHTTFKPIFKTLEKLVKFDKHGYSNQVKVREENNARRNGVEEDMSRSSVLLSSEELLSFARHIVNLYVEVSQSALTFEKLPVESSFWYLDVKIKGDSRLLQLRNTKNSICVLTDKLCEASIKLAIDDGIDISAQYLESPNTFMMFIALCMACLVPLKGKPRRPIAVIDRQNVFAMPYRKCSCCHLLIPCESLYACPKCRCSLYCSKECALCDYPNHSSDCEMMLMSKGFENQLQDQPFTFSHITVSERFDDTTLTSLLRNNGTYNLGMWIRETPYCPNCSFPPPYGEISIDLDPYVLPIEGMILEDYDIAAPSQPLKSWGDYYQWRGFQLSSPIAQLLHHVLTVYHILQLDERCKEKITLVLAGVEKEADFVVTFYELSALLPDTKINITMIGPSISPKVSGSCFVYRNITVTRQSMLLQDFLSGHCTSVDLVICLNAGLSVCPAWKGAILSLISMQIPCYVTDYCLISLELSQQALSSLNTSDDLLKLVQLSVSDRPGSMEDEYKLHAVRLSPPILNPFRSPFRKFFESASMPWFSHAYISKLLYI